MTIKLSGFDGTPFTPQKHASAAGDRFIKTYLKAVFSGNYPTGGDLLDLTNGNGTPTYPNTIPPATAGGLVGIQVLQRGPTGGYSGTPGFGVIVPPNTDAPITVADAALLKLKLITGAASEYAAGAYGTDVTGDEFILECTWAR